MHAELRGAAGQTKIEAALGRNSMAPSNATEQNAALPKRQPCGGRVPQMKLSPLATCTPQSHMWESTLEVVFHHKLYSRSKQDVVGNKMMHVDTGIVRETQRETKSS